MVKESPREAEDAQGAGGEEHERGRFRYRTCLRSNGEDVANVEGSDEEGGLGSGSRVEQISVIREFCRATRMGDDEFEAPAQGLGIEDELAIEVLVPKEGGIEGQEGGKGLDR
jgi:hypothetical protein